MTATETETELTLTAYHVGGTPMKLVPASPKRAWMDASRDRFAYRCLPLVMANQAGWWVVNDRAFRAVWNGSPEVDGVQVKYSDGKPGPAKSHFGEGVLTISLPFLFRLPAGWNLWIQPPANFTRDGIAGLEGLVEADWSTASFTMNYKFTRPNCPVTFPANEPIAQLIPMRRGELESFCPVISNITADPELAREYQEWNASRGKFLRDMRRPGTEASKAKWQRDYLRGRSATGKPAPEHQTKLCLRPFQDLRKEKNNGRN